jgi:hypothetical protein
VNYLTVQLESNRSKRARRLRVAENLVSAYVSLPSGNVRGYVEGFLAAGVYGDLGMARYTPASDRHRAAHADHNTLREFVEMGIHKPWSKWANMIKKANLRDSGSCARHIAA